MKSALLCCISIVLSGAQMAITEVQDNPLSDAEILKLECSLLQHQAAVFSTELNYPSAALTKDYSVTFDQRGIDMRRSLARKIEGRSEVEEMWTQSTLEIAKILASDNTARMTEIIRAAEACASPNQS